MDIQVRCRGCEELFEPGELDEEGYCEDCVLEEEEDEDGIDSDC